MRMKELLSRLHREDPSIRLYVMGMMPRWAFDEYPIIPINHRPLRCDVGAIQKDSLHLDVTRTLEENAGFYGDIDRLVRSEVDFIRREKIDLIVGDIPPLAFLAAEAAGVKSIAIGNFSWDWIYEEYAEQRPRYRCLVDLVRDAYSRADLLLRLPFHGDMGAFHTVRDVPLISRSATIPRPEVRRRLGIDPDEKRKVVFISMGGHDNAGIVEGAEADFGDYVFVSFFNLSDRMKQLILPEDRAGIPHPDIVHASDCVISKPGYCTVAECIANRTPLVYTSRDNFREFPVMEAAVKQYCRSYCLPRDDFHAGTWRKHLDAFFNEERPFHWPEIPTDGAASAARIILEWLKRH
jgi:L-arabinokinase